MYRDDEALKEHTDRVDREAMTTIAILFLLLILVACCAAVTIVGGYILHFMDAVL